jgi:CheY-like chemotaxis protein
LLMRAQGDYFMVLMDLMMPVMDGFEATRRIVQSEAFERKKPMIVALTASVTEQEVNAARDAGCNDVLSKPVNLARLRQAVHAAAQQQNIAKPRFVLGAQRLIPLPQ